MNHISLKLKEIYRERALLIIMAPTLILFIIFYYVPIYGLNIAFKDLQAGKTIANSSWVGFKWFTEFFNSPYFWRSLKNTVILSTSYIAFSFPTPILFALTLNELKDGPLKRITQSVSYFPHFVSLVVVIGMMFNFLSVDYGIVNNLLQKNGMDTINFFLKPGWFRPLYIITGIWQNLGWNTIVYLAALSAVDPALYESARMDGAKRIQMMRHISLPSISSTIVILLLLSLGSMFKDGFEKVILMYNPVTYEVSDIVSTFVYRTGIQNAQYSYAAAVDFFNQGINFILLVFFNTLSKKLGGESLW